MNIWKNLMRAALGLLVVVSVSASVLAQGPGKVNRYSQTAFTATYSTIYGAGGTQIAGGGDDGQFAFTGPPFAFNYDSVAYSASATWYGTWNGAFGPTSATNGYYGDPIGVAMASSICYWETDDYVSTGFYTLTTGSAPNRVFTMEAVNWGPYGRTYNQYTQVKLYETSNNIEIIFQSHNANIGVPSDAAGGGTGLNGGTPSADYNRFSGSTQSTTPSTDVRFIPPPPPPPPS